MRSAISLGPLILTKMEGSRLMNLGAICSRKRNRSEARFIYFILLLLIDKIKFRWWWMFVLSKHKAVGFKYLKYDSTGHKSKSTLPSLHLGLPHASAIVTASAIGTSSAIGDYSSNSSASSSGQMAQPRRFKIEKFPKVPDLRCWDELLPTHYELFLQSHYQTPHITS